MPWSVAIPLSAFWMSILHELEHDLIHQTYDRKNKSMNNLMLATVYAFRPSTIQPWVRRDIHLHHHKSSGTKSDLEERGINHGLKFYAVSIATPNFLRTLSLHFTSSNIHYYGDVEDGNIVQQCQIWTDWRMKPLQDFCFNFGGTHAVHHFVVRNPFYIRQAIAQQCYPAMKENGVRFNDFGTFKRANRRLDKSVNL